jgi:1,4-alpha-glucan branching enzyme
MPKTISKQAIRRRRVTFSTEAAGANEVILMGDFNKWDPKVHPMKKDGSSTFTKSIIIPPGKYEYKFLIDGSWKEDPENEQACPNCFGTLNSVLNVG